MIRHCDSYLLLSILVVLTFTGLSCSQDQKVSSSEPQVEKDGTQLAAEPAVKPVKVPIPDSGLVGKPIYPPALILKSFTVFWDYFVRNIKLDEDYHAFDSQANPIKKQKFLQLLSSGKYYPLAVHSKDFSRSYKLQRLSASDDVNISTYMSLYGKQSLVYIELIGKPVPRFSFRDINGTRYTSENTKGKIVTFKCWFISCVPCVKEMPALNNLVQIYKGNKDVLFISLAIDAPAELKQFLNKTRFDYHTVANQKDYMEKQLGVTGYPTHYLINRKGIVTQVADTEEQLAKGLASEVKNSIP
jgi:peroxiredoxin